MLFDIKIKPIKGCEDMTHEGEPDERRKAIKKCAMKIQEMLGRKGISVRIVESGTRSYPRFDLLTDDRDRYIIAIMTGPIYTFRIVLWSFYGALNYDIKYDESTMQGIIQYKDTIYRADVLTVDNSIRALYISIFDYLENIFKTGELSLTNFIEFLIPRMREISRKREELYNKTKSIIEQNEKFRQLPIIEDLLKGKETLEFNDWLTGIHRVAVQGSLLYIDDKLKFISENKSDYYKGEIVEKNVPWFDFLKGKRINKTLYIYEEIDKVPVYTFQIEEDVKEEKEIKEDFTLEDFKNQMKKLEKFDLYYPNDVLEKFYAAINSGNRFVILAGATGTGKTLLSLLYPACLYKYKGDEKSILEELVEESKDENELKEKIQKKLERYVRFIRVAPNWTSPKDIIGYINPLAEKGKERFIKGKYDLYDFLVKANEEENKDFFLIFDEMNLSHPEYYLSDILSAMETKGNINIHGSNDVEKEERIKRKIPYPLKENLEGKHESNLYIIGTINLDETTKELSPRLKSRAFTIEMRAYFDKYQEKYEDKDEKQIAEILGIIDTHLKKIGLGIGYRDIKHIKEYWEKRGKDDKAIGEALIQKIIPRIHTSDEKFEKVIKNLTEELDEKFKDKTEEFQKELDKLKEKFESQKFV